MSQELQDDELGNAPRNYAEQRKVLDESLEDVPRYDAPAAEESPAWIPTARPYGDAVEEYLDAADWLGPADAPLKVHARAIARSLDRQLEAKGEVQSALASSFDKVLLRLDKRRPPAAPRATDPLDPAEDGTPSMLGFLSD